MEPDQSVSDSQKNPVIDTYLERYFSRFKEILFESHGTQNGIWSINLGFKKLHELFKFEMSLNRFKEIQYVRPPLQYLKYTFIH